MKKSRFNLSHLHSTTLNMGQLVPFFLQDTLPNDSYRLSSRMFMRMQPMLAPIMHEVFIYTQYWYVPYRLLWYDFEDFITGKSVYEGSVAPAYPYLQAPADTGFKAGSLADYFGFPIEKPEIKVSALPFRAMALIWNERYRDQDLQHPIDVNFESGKDTQTSTALLSPCWTKGYFTTARNSTQRGGEIGVPIGAGSSTDLIKVWNSPLFYCSSDSTELSTTSATWGTAQKNTLKMYASAEFQALIKQKFDAQYTPTVDSFKIEISVSYDELKPVADKHGGLDNMYFFQLVNERLQNNGIYTIKVGQSVKFTLSSDSFKLDNLPNTDAKLHFMGYSTSSLQALGNPLFLDSDKTYGNVYRVQQVITFKNLYSSSGTQDYGVLDIRDLRYAAAMQRFQENSLEYGNRYEELIQREFGNRPRDGRIQRPEYLGGGKSLMNISEVLQTSPAESSYVGSMSGHGVAGHRDRTIRFKCPEHGLIIGLVSIRPKHVLTQGIERVWRYNRTRFDFYWPELANIGMEEIYTDELYADKDTQGSIFGYQARNDYLRSRTQRITGEFRTQLLDHWNLARQFDRAPVLNESFVSMASDVDTTFKRIFAEQTQHSVLAMIKNHCFAYRAIPKRAKNKLL